MQQLEYRPHRVYVWFIPGCIAAGAIMFVAAGGCLLEGDKKGFLYGLLSVVSLVLTVQLWKEAKLLLLFEPKGVRIIGDRISMHRFIPWEDLHNAYESCTFRGHKCILLSPNELKIQEIKAYANRGATCSQACIDDVIVIFYRTHDEKETIMKGLPISVIKH